MNQSTKKTAIYRIGLCSVGLICLGLISYSVAADISASTVSASTVSQQEKEMRKMVLEMVRTSMLQSCEGLQTLECIDLNESRCKKMMNEVLAACIEPAIDNPKFTDDGSCGNKVVAKYGITEASAQRCGVDIEGE